VASAAGLIDRERLLQQPGDVGAGGELAAALQEELRQRGGAGAEREAQVIRGALAARDAELGEARREARRVRGLGPKRDAGGRKVQHTARGAGGRRGARGVGLAEEAAALQDQKVGHRAVRQEGALRRGRGGRRRAVRGAGEERRDGLLAERGEEALARVHGAPLLDGGGAALEVDRRLEDLRDRAPGRGVVE
jgi:hypothetical protein